MQWHYDAFSVPAGATVLVQSPAGPQAMVCGRALGLQFHPEATESIVRTWSSGSGEEELTTNGLSIDEIMGATRANRDDAAGRCDEWVDWCLTDVAQRHME